MTPESPFPAGDYEASAREAEAMAVDFDSRTPMPVAAPVRTSTISGRQLDELRRARGQNVDLGRLRADNTQAAAGSGSSAD